MQKSDLVQLFAKKSSTIIICKKIIDLENLHTKKTLRNDTKNDHIQQFAKKKWYDAIIKRKNSRPVLARANYRVKLKQEAYRTIKIAIMQPSLH